jgi:TonB-dependent receptor
MQKNSIPAQTAGRIAVRVKVSFFCFLFFNSLLISKGVAQDIHQKKISIRFNTITLRDALLELQEVSGFNLVYNRALLGLDRNVNLELKNEPVEQVLKQLLGTEYEFKQVENNIIISRKPESGKKIHGSLRGKVIDEATGEPLIGANVWIPEVSQGASVNVDGEYRLSQLPAGTYSVVISFLGYDTKTLSGVSVKANETTTVPVSLSGSSTQLSEIVVKGDVDVRTAQVKHTDDINLLREIQTSDLIVTGISSLQISRSLDFNAAEVVQRAPGVTVIDNFINVRGLYERYNMVYINNMIAPSSESDRRAFSFDLLPSGVIDKIMIYRNPAPELPGDFAGGLVKIHTKDAVPARQLQIRFATQYRQGSSGRDTYTYKGGDTDWLGFDDGTRALPSSFPAVGKLPYIHNAGTPDPQAVAENAGYGRKLDNNWNLISNAPVGLDYRGQLNYYDSWKIGQVRLSNLSSLFYTREFQTIRQQFQVGPDADPDVKYTDSIFHRTARAGMMQNFIVKVNDNHSFYFDNFFNQLGRDETLLRGGREFEGVSPSDSVMQVQYFWQERSLYTGQLGGKHAFKAGGRDHSAHWGGGYAYTYEDVPNLRRYEIRYTSRDATGSNRLIATDELGGEGFEFNLQNYRSTKEKAYSYFADTEWSLPYNIKLKTGAFTEFKTREFNNRYITIRPGPDFAQEDGTLSLTGPSRQYVLDQLLGGNFRLDGSGFIVRDQTLEGSGYRVTNDYYAGYVGVSIPFFHERLKIYGGVRYEWNRFRLINTQYEDLVVRDVDQLTRFFLPSLNASWKLNDKNMLLRAAYGKSLNRPQFRELSAFRNFDLDEGYTVGNPDLVTAEIQNIDLRWEYYPADGEWLSAGLFYKDFKNPIEMVSVTQSGALRPSSQLQNTAGAHAWGIETEVRKSLAFVPGKFFRHLSVILNGSYMWNEVRLDSTDADYGNDLRDTRRPLQGTTPYLVNATLYYDNVTHGTTVSVQYNVFGQRLYIAANTLYSDIFERSRHSLDLSVRQRIFKNFELQAGVKNVLNQAYRYYRDFYRDGTYDPTKVAESKELGEGGNIKGGSDYYFKNYKEGRYFSIGINYTLQ